MSTPTDLELTETLYELADDAGPVPSGLAALALAQGRRMRARRLSFTAVAWAAAVVVLVAPVLWATSTHPGSRHQTAVAPTSTQGPPSMQGWFLASGTGSDGRILVWSRTSGRYVPMTADEAWVAPVGDFAMVVHGGSVQLRNLASQKSTKLPGGDVMTPSWTEDGTHLIYSIWGPYGGGSRTLKPKVVIVDAISGKARTFDLGHACAGICVAASWMPDGQEFAALADTGSAGRLYLFAAATASPAGTLEVSADVGADLSADGRFIVENADDGGVEESRVRDRIAGTSVWLHDVFDIRTVRWIDDSHFLMITHGSVVEYDTQGHLVLTASWPPGFGDNEPPQFSLARR